MMTDVKEWVAWFRHASPYINAQRNQVMVLALSGEALAHTNLENIIQNKNKITDIKNGNFIFRQQVLTDLPPKELRSIVDQGKKDIKSGIIMACCIYEEKVGVAIGVTDELINKFDAVKLVKDVAEILGGKGGGGRKDFAQAGGINKNKINEAFKALSKKIN